MKGFTEESGDLVFFVNGKKIVDSHVDPEWTLLYYLRQKLRLCGTKLGCAEGGCGACTVMVSRMDRATGRLRHLAVNACLAPVCAMHGQAVTTVEGIGSTRTRLHPVQERLAKAHGSQCGFCTPGIVMSMYALLRTLPRPSMHDLEVAMEGNLCRCTGYRPILEGFRSFTEDYEELQAASRTQGLPGRPGPARCAMGDQCCQVNGGGCGGVNGHVNGGITNGYANGVNGHANGVNGHDNGDMTNGHANGVNGHDNGVMTNGHANGVNGHDNGVMTNGHANGVNGHVNGGITNGHANGVNGLANGVNGHANGVNGYVNGGITNGHGNGVNGHGNGVNGHGNGGISNGHANGVNGHAYSVNGDIHIVNSSDEIGSIKDAKGLVSGDLVNGVPVLPGQGGINALGALKKTSADDQCVSPETFAPYDPSQEPIFPPELKKSGVLDKQALRFVGPRVTWLRPTSLLQLLDLKQQHPEAKIVTGNSEIGVETKFRSLVYPVLISTSAIRELLDVSVEEAGAVAGLRVGAACPLSQVNEVLRAQIRRLPKYKTRSLAAMSSMLRWFAGNQIRNVAGAGGNIMTGSPISDLNPVFMAAGCILDLRSASGRRHLPMDGNFFTGYRRNAVRPDEVLVSILVPFTAVGEHMCALKQARRREDDIAIVNLALRLRLHPGAGGGIQDAAVAVGGMAATTVMPAGVREVLLKGYMDNATLEAAVSALALDLPVAPGAPGGMVRYRQTLALSLFAKAFLTIASEMPGVAGGATSPLLGRRLLSATKPLTERPIASGQYFRAVPGTQDRTDFVGRPVVHQSAYKQATGEAVYCDDIRPTVGELYVTPVLSTRAHARIVSVDVSAALAVPGVYDVLTAADLPADENKFGAVAQDEEILASREVVCHGQPLAAVVASDSLTGRRAATLVKVEYEDLPAILSIEDAMAAESFLVPPIDMAVGDAGAALERAEHVVEGEIRSGAQEHFYLETQACVAVPKEDGEMEMTASTQAPTAMQETIARVMGVPRSRVVVKVKRLGGGFGGKEVRAVPFAVLCAIAANKHQRVVRLMLDRDEDMLSTGQRHPFLTRYKVAFDAEGRLLAFRLHLYSNGGCSEDLSTAVMERALHHCQNSYRVPHIHLTGYCCKTNMPSFTAFRGFGGPQALFVAETIIRHVASHVGRDVLEVAELNMFVEGDTTVYHHRLTDCNAKRCWDEVLQQSDYHRRLRDVHHFNRQNRYVKRGLAVVPLTYGVAYSVSFLNQAGALVQVYTDGAVLLTHGGTEMGQGLHTKMLQVASRALGIDASYIHITETSTDKVPNTSATAASFSSDLNGMAVKNACDTILERLRPFREANPDGRWEDWVRDAYFQCVSLSATGYHRTPGINYNLRANSGRAYEYHAYGACCCEVELDCLTGDHKVLRTDIVMDLGESLNPAIDVGQIEGGFMQGYGLFVIEEPVVAASGALISRGPGAYKIPGFGDVPAEFHVTLLKGSSNPRAIYSSKAVGEPPLLLSCCVPMALREAVAAARREEGLDGWFHLDAPATAAVLRMACEDRITRRFPEPAKGTFKPWNIRV